MSFGGAKPQPIYFTDGIAEIKITGISFAERRSKSFCRIVIARPAAETKHFFPVIPPRYRLRDSGTTGHPQLFAGAFPGRPMSKTLQRLPTSRGPPGFLVAHEKRFPRCWAGSKVVCQCPPEKGVLQFPRHEGGGIEAVGARGAARRVNGPLELTSPIRPQVCPSANQRR